MKETWIEVQPGGYLKKYGNHKFLVSSPAEAIKAMLMLVPGFETAFRESEKRGAKFKILSGKHNVNNVEQLYMGKPSVVKIIPKYAGAKNGAFTFLAAAAVIAAVVLTGGTAGFGAGAWFAASSTSAAIATSVAVSLALGGVSMLLAPKTDGLTNGSDVENKASYAFGGPVNTTAQGQPVPAFYGEREVGGAVISASIAAEDQQ